MKRILTLSTLAICPIVFAQPVVQAEVAKLQPQIGRDDGGFNSCGVRAVVVVGRGKFVDTYDFSLNLYSRMFTGLMKAGKYRTNMNDFLAGKTDGAAYLPAPEKIWIAKETEGTPVISQKVIPSEDKGFSLGSGELIKTLEVMTAMAAGERMQFAIKNKTEPYDIVVTFASALPEHEMRPLLTCTRSLIERMSKEIEK